MTEPAPAPTHAPTPAPAPTPTPAPAPSPAPSPAPAPTPAPPNAFVNDDGKTEPAPQSKWPDAWREEMAGGDAKALERLKRFTAPSELFKSFLEADTKIRSGKPVADVPMPDAKTDADGAKKWREERGIPVDATGYTLPDAVTKRLTDADKPIMADFTEFAHQNNLPPKAVAVAAEWYTNLVETEAAQTNANDKKAEEATQESLREEWGPEYKPFKEVARRYATEAIPGVNWYEARLPDGRALGNVPEIVKAMAKFGMAEYGDVSFAGGEKTQQTMTRKAEIERVQKEDFSKYEGDPAMRKEYFDILEAEAKRQPKA